jgi:23S rRNA pseudouridine1911/1915/1917 synthase
MAQAIVVPADDPRGKLAIMHWRVLARTDAGTWLEVQLETGRTHQIRVQTASRGHAVVGDTQYGATQPFGEQFEDERLRSIALHARQLGFNHPMMKEPVDVIAPVPPAWHSLGLDLERDDRLENDPRFLERIAKARKSLLEGKGIRLEDVK